MEQFIFMFVSFDTFVLSALKRLRLAVFGCNVLFAFYLVLLVCFSFQPFWLIYLFIL